MKLYRKISYILFIPIGALLFLSSCSDEKILDKPPLDRYTDAAVWTDLSLAGLFLNETYDGVPSGFDRGFYLLDAATDAAVTGYPWAYSHYWNRGDFTPLNPPLFGVPWDGGVQTQWQRGYYFIRKCNLLLQKVPLITGDEDKKKGMIAEAKFLRALFYHELVKFYGGVPIIETPQTLEDIDKLLVPRNSYDECVNFIIKNLDEAAADLPDVRTGEDVGRASKGAALALKGRQLLYAEKWAESAAASKDAMSITAYSLFPNYEGMFWAVNNNNSEVYFARQYKSLATNRTHQFNQWNALYTMNGWGGTQPTQNFVDQYEMTDGLPYDQSPLYNPDHPYKNRDPRFHATIIYDSTIFNSREIQLKDKGKDGIGTANDATKTGYNLRKFMDTVIMNSNWNNGYNDWIILRLGEVLLNYAEAQNEAVGPDASVYNAINAIRDRPSVKMPPIPAGLSKDEMREKIRHERTIELAFEEHRFFDLRRWKANGSGPVLAETVLNEPVFGMRIDSTRTTYTRFKYEDRVYKPQQRYLPLPQAEINKDSKLVQNPGW